MKKQMTFIEVLEDRKEGGGRSMIGTIEEYLSDINDQPERYESDYKFGLEETIKRLEEEKIGRAHV